MSKRGTLALLLAAIACFGIAGNRNAALLSARREHHITPATTPIENASPLMAFTTVVLGGFRGLIADLLWLRVSSLQERGRYFELVQLSDWITKLEPRSTEIWAFHAWNMAYNVSVMMPDPEDRWRWVRNGLALLRDEALRYHTGDPELYAELGWLFQHKLGGTTDDLHLYYKQQWADEMTSLLDGPRPDYATAAATVRRRLRDDYGMELDTMREIEQRYGQLDWRLPEAHALYWACRGRQQARDLDTLTCDRMIFQCLNELTWQGALSYDRKTGDYRRGPHVALLNGALRAYRDAMARHGDDVGEAYENFLRSATRRLHALGREQDAQRVFLLLKQTFPATDTDTDLRTFISQPPRPRGVMPR